MNILSIQSWVAYGHVGNSSAMFPMQRLGHEVWAIHTVQFSNHTGYGAWKGRVFDAPMIEELIEGIAERGVLPRCDGVLSGYMGSADIGTGILSAVGRVRAANAKALYCCDPVIGDVGRGVFVRPGIPEFMRDQAAERFESHLRAPWRPRSGSMVNRKALTSAMIDSRDFLAARRRAEREVLLPEGPKIALTGGYDFQDHQAVWTALDRVHAKHPDMVLIHGGSPKGAEHIASLWARERKIAQVAFKPDFNRFKNAAPFRRNDQMLEILPIGVIVFPGNGINDNLADKARKMGIPLFDFRQR